METRNKPNIPRGLQRGQRECVPASLKARPTTTWFRSPVPMLEEFFTAGWWHGIQSPEQACP